MMRQVGRASLLQRSDLNRGRFFEQCRAPNPSLYVVVDLEYYQQQNRWHKLCVVCFLFARCQERAFEIAFTAPISN